MSLYFYYIVTLIYLIVHIMYRIAFEINYSVLFYSILNKTVNSGLFVLVDSSIE